MLPVFFAFRIMVGIGLLLIPLGFVGAYLWWRGRLFEAALVLRPMRCFLAAGLHRDHRRVVLTEIGRQPWVAQGIMRTAEAASPSPGAVLTTLILFILVYSPCTRRGSPT